MWTTSRRPPEVFKELGGHSSLFAFMPYLPERIYRREIYNKLKKIRDIAERELEEHERTFEPDMGKITCKMILIKDQDQ